MQETTTNEATTGTCPIDPTYFSHQKTAQKVKQHQPNIELDANGIWQVRGFDAARMVLRSTTTKQAGFNADLLEHVEQKIGQPILYQEGKEHQQQRKQTASFFTPKTVNDSYRAMMETLSRKLIRRLLQQKTYDLSELSLEMAVHVAARIVGLTHSTLPGMSRRLEAFFGIDIPDATSDKRAMIKMLLNQRHTLAFLYLDVKPAIKDHRKHPRKDVISHLIEQNSSDLQIFTECVTYGAAGMATTREFISVAAWHLLEKPALKERFLIAPEEERYAILHEILRLEPIVGNIYRRATEDITIQQDGEEVIIPAGALINVNVDQVNQDSAIVGAYPQAICPGRELRSNQIPGMLMSFGDGTHRCPGAYVAIQESDIFLTKLLSIENLHIERKPSISWNKLITGYEIRNFIVAIG